MDVELTCDVRIPAFAICYFHFGVARWILINIGVFLNSERPKIA